MWNWKTDFYTYTLHYTELDNLVSVSSLVVVYQDESLSSVWEDFTLFPRVVSWWVKNDAARSNLGGIIRRRLQGEQFYLQDWTETFTGVNTTNLEA